MQGMVDAFNASQSDVKVNHTPMTADDLYQKLPLAVQTAQGVPDVAIVHIERIPMFVKQEMIWPLDTLLENGIVKEKLHPQRLGPYRHRWRALRRAAGCSRLCHLHQQGPV